MASDRGTKQASSKSSPEGRGFSPLQKGVLAAVALLLVLSVAARIALGGSAEEKAGTQAVPGASSQFLPGQTPTGQLPPGAGQQPVQEEPGSLEKALPYITEASFFAMIGFALGFAAKKFMKLGLILLALCFVGLQVLAYTGVVSVDWGRAVDLLNRFVLNLKEDQSITEALTARIPSGGALLGAFFIGLKAG